jgi:coproporphyrinogen III oxidase-like Fe-S oxidoreductase
MRMSGEENKKLPIRLGFELNQEDVFTRKIMTLAKYLSIKKSEFKAEIDYFKDILDSLEERGLIEQDEEEIRLTETGLLWHDNILWDFTNSRQKRLTWKIMY